MKIIYSIDAIKPPLTGIGRYTWELSRRMPFVQGIDSVRYLSQARWISRLEPLLDRRPAAISLRQHFLGNRLAVGAYRLLYPLILQRRLKGLSDHLFHGPNFYLPPCPGPAIATFHDLSIFRYPQFHPATRVAFMEKELPIALGRADFLISDSEFVRREVIEYFNWPADRIRAIPLGVSEAFHPQSRGETSGVLGALGLDHGGYALCVSTIEPRKNIGSLLSAFERLPAAIRARYPLVLVGGRGWQSEDLHQRIAKAERQGWLRYLGYVPEGNLPALFAGARGFFFPSFYEGFGLPVVEAMASGVPVLISDRSSLPEVAKGAAIIVPAEDVPQMTEGIRKALEDDVWRTEAIARSLQVAREYRWESTAQKTADLYRTVLQRAFGADPSAQ